MMGVVKGGNENANNLLNRSPTLHGYTVTNTASHILLIRMEAKQTV
jgi:hypothetical protein